MATAVKQKDPDVDGGFAWAILTGCFLMYMVVVGGIKAYGVLYTEMVSVYASGSGNTAWIGSTTLLLMFGLGPVANLLSQRFTFRTVAFVGGLLVGLGFVTSSFVPSIEYMYLTFGICAGLGYGLSFSPCSTIISFYFEEKRALANGVAVSASGVGALVFPFIYQFLIKEFGLHGTFLILGGFALNICAAACIFRQPRLLSLAKQKSTKRHVHEPEDTDLLNGDTSHNQPKDKTVSQNCCTNFFSLFKFSLFCNPLFSMYVVAFILCMNGYGNNLILIPAHLKALGYDRVKIALGISVMGAFEVVARIFFGWFADKGYVKKRTLFIFNMGVSAIFCFIAPLFTNYYFFLVYAAIIGTFPGSFWSLISVLIIDVVGMKDFTAAFGLVSLCLAVGSAISQPTIGWLQDASGSWNSSFILTGCLLLASAFIVMTEPLIKRCMKRKKLERNEATVELVASDGNPPKRLSTASLARENEEKEILADDVPLKSERISPVYRPYEHQKPPPVSSYEDSLPFAFIDDV
ncbi:monocarboxylate transporter 12-like [Dreissena polymorpha]|uniref:Major facilitator superfamily (MFS) profile domain-containing protein n=1 Tax=Dreissena polymorpha TaxID=45954 RepID=A0A9D4LBQ2_DREPO|nr:monocarboxylate transporter 12-like [Dreissena polymorpha]XP_052269471.1 monocarboxylate transporter 12-like [Dreissena polymorpha]XP_052269472.1 monocarboxylate transporter 12-like [Dreissena polymorpha]XP_052269473.1 monocarboxylate transporter 12-like [Dreissena polymorpha]KAH3855145.1 hypothetical protein DPMN_097706 [Dreissena polymorpha]